MFSRLFNRTARRFAGIDFLELIPSAQVEHQIDTESQQVILLVPRYTDPVFGRLIQPRLGPAKKHIRLPLEPRGSWIWLQINGISPVGDLVQGFREEFQDDQMEAPERLSGYMFNLWENNFIKFNNLPK